MIVCVDSFVLCIDNSIFFFKTWLSSFENCIIINDRKIVEVVFVKQRALGAAILLLVFLPLFFIGGEWFALFIALVSGLGLKELWDIKYEKRAKKDQLPWILEVLSFLCLWFLVLNHWDTDEILLVLDYRILSLFLIIFLIPIIILNDSKKYNLEDAMFLLGSVTFLGLSFNLIILMRNFSLWYLFYLFLITTMTDTFALFTGMLVGRHALAPKISPKKTIEGLIGGTVMGVFIASTFYLTVIDSSISIWVLIGVTTLLSLVGQCGDLVFSAVKRYYGKKDFSNLIPGHGGILDRFDSIIFVVITAVLFLSVL